MQYLVISMSNLWNSSLIVKLVTSDLISELKNIIQNRAVLTEPYWIELAGDALSSTEDTNQWHKLYASIEKESFFIMHINETGLSLEDIL